MNSFKEWIITRNFEFRFKIIYLLPVAVILIGLDWITKILVVSKMQYDQEYINAIPGIMDLKYILNPGSAYGMMENHPNIAITLAALVTTFITVFFIFLNDRKFLIAAVVMWSGSFANLIARSWAPTVNGMKSSVVDFLVWHFDLFGSRGYIFNLADLWVNISVGLIILFLIIYIGDIIYMQIIKKHEDYFEFISAAREKIEIILNLTEKKWFKSKFREKIELIKTQRIEVKNIKQSVKTFKKEWKESKVRKNEDN